MNKVKKTTHEFHLKQNSMSIFILPLNSSHSLKCCQLRSTFWRFLVKLLSSSEESYSNRNPIFVGQTMNPTNMTKTPSSSSNLIFLCTQCNFASQTIMAVGHNESQLVSQQTPMRVRSKDPKLWDKIPGISFLAGKNLYFSMNSYRCRWKVIWMVYLYNHVALGAETWFFSQPCILLFKNDVGGSFWSGTINHWGGM